MGEYMSTREAADYLHISDRTLRNYIRENKIRYMRMSERIILFKKEWLDEFIEQSTIEPKKQEDNTNE